MRKQFVVIGLGRFGTSVAKTLSMLGHDVLAIDSSESAVQAIMHDVTHAVQADARDEETLTTLGVRNFEIAVVAVGHDLEANILITVLLKEMGIKFVVAKAVSALHGKVLTRVGADKVVYPEKDMGTRVAYNLVSGNVMDFIELSPDYGIIELIAPGKFVDKSLGELNLRAKYGISVMAIKKAEEIVVAPGADYKISVNDTLVFVGKIDVLNNLPNDQ